MAPSTMTETCIICGEPKIKNYPLHKCSTCGKLVHRKCASALTGSHLLNCTKCIPKNSIEGDKNKKNIGVGSALRGKAQATPSISNSNIVKSRSSLTNIQSRRSSTTQKGCNCNCIEVFRN